MIKKNVIGRKTSVFIVEILLCEMEHLLTPSHGHTLQEHSKLNSASFVICDAKICVSILERLFTLVLNHHGTVT